MTRRFPAVVLAIFFVNGAAAGEVRFETTSIRDVPYEEVDGTRLHLDLTVPQTPRADRPAILFLHGGGWSAGDKASEVAVKFGQDFAARGYVFASINYRLSGQAIWPAAIQDGKAAVRWLKAQSREYGIDPQRIVAMGYSAGALLAALLGTTRDVAKLNGDLGPAAYGTGVAATISISGTYDATSRFRSGVATNSIVRFLGGTPDDVPDRYRQASPIRYADHAVPFLLVHGTQDRVVEFAQAPAFERALRRAQVYVETLYQDGASHKFVRTDAGHDAILQRSLRFLDTVWKSRQAAS